MAPASVGAGTGATSLPRAGGKFLDMALPDYEVRLRALHEKPTGYGSLLVVVDQPATTGALAGAVAQDMGITARYLPGSMKPAA